MDTNSSAQLSVGSAMYGPIAPRPSTAVKAGGKRGGGGGGGAGGRSGGGISRGGKHRSSGDYGFADAEEVESRVDALPRFAQQHGGGGGGGGGGGTGARF
jgi:hypothetical protein